MSPVRSPVTEMLEEAGALPSIHVSEASQATVPRGDVEETRALDGLSLSSSRGCIR